MKIKTRYEYRIIFECGDVQRIPYIHPYHYITHPCRVCRDYRIIREYQIRAKRPTGETWLFSPDWETYEFPERRAQDYAQRTGQSYGDYKPYTRRPEDWAYTPSFI